MTTFLNTTTHRIQLARDFHRSITNTKNVELVDRNSVTPVSDIITTIDVVAGQTNILVSYTPGRVEVFVDNIKIDASQYYATTGTSITFVFPFSAPATVTVVRLNILLQPNPSDFFYAFLGRTQPWPNDLLPSNAIDSRAFESQTKRDIISVKRVLPNDVAIMARRKNWEPGTVYTAWSDIVELSESDNFYVMTTAFRIYKCLYQPTVNDVPVPSTVQPNDIQPGPFQTSDGYVWQLLYEVPVADRVKLLTADYIPVKFFSTSTSFDHNGSIDEILVLNGGTNYTEAPTIIILGDGFGAEAEAEITGQEITRIIVTNGGFGYTFAKALVLGGNGFGVETEVILRSIDLPNQINQNVAAYASTMAGAINFVTVTSPGSNYDANTNLSVRGDGVGAILSPVIEGGQLVRVDVLDSGRGYTFAEITINGSGAGASVRAVIEPSGGHGSNVPAELFATTVGIAINIEDTLKDFFLQNDFRQIGLLKNVETYYRTGIYDQLTGTACYKATIDPVILSNISVDDILVSEMGGRFRVISVSGSEALLLPIIDNLDINQRLTNETTGDDNIILTELQIPEINVANAPMLCVENISPVRRSDGQTEQLKFFVRF